MQAQPAMTPQPAGNMMSSIAHTLVPPPYKQEVPHPPAQHNISTMNELVMEGKVCSPCSLCSLICLILAAVHNACR